MCKGPAVSATDGESNGIFDEYFSFDGEFQFDGEFFVV